LFDQALTFAVLPFDRLDRVLNFDAGDASNIAQREVLEDFQSEFVLASVAPQSRFVEQLCPLTLSQDTELRRQSRLVRKILNDPLELFASFTKALGFDKKPHHLQSLGVILLVDPTQKQ